MKRKKFIKILGSAGIGLSISSLAQSCTPPKVSKIKKGLPNYWIWMRPSSEKSDDDFKSEFADIRSMGIEAVLPQIYASNKALFNIEGYETETPLLERLIPLAHEAGLQIHAWMWTMPCNNPRIISEHPDWYAVNRKNEPAHAHLAYVDYYKFLCPRKTDVREFVQHRVKALANISDLDGIHLDYVRLPDVILAEALQPNYNIVQDQEYPEYDYCYCKTCRDAYKDKSGIDPMEIQDPANDKDWYQFRYDAVVDMVNDYLVPAARNKDKLITAAVFPNWESVRQQWHKFDLDAFLPMLYQGFYNEDIDWIGAETKKAIGRLNNNKPIYSGMFLPHLKTPAELEKAVQSAKDGGAKGFALFSYNDLNEEMKEGVRSVILRQ